MSLRHAFASLSMLFLLGSPALAHPRVELVARPSKIVMTEGETANLGLVLQRNGRRVAVDASRLSLEDDSAGSLLATPLSFGLTREARFLVIASGSGTFTLTATLFSGDCFVARTAISIKVQPRRPQLARIQLLARMPCGMTQDVTGLTLEIAEGERVLLQAVGFDRSGNRVPLSAQFLLTDTESFLLRNVGPNQVEIAACCDSLSATLLVQDPAAPCLTASVELRREE